MSSGIFVAGNLSPSTKLYRYVSLSTLLHFVETERTYLTWINEWDDRWEAPLLRAPVIEENGEVTSYEHIARMMFGQCWSLKKESDAMWRIYSPNREGILLETSVERFDLLTSITDGLLAPVIYTDDVPNARKLIPPADGLKALFWEGCIKRLAFEHEEEVRLITLNLPTCLSDSLQATSTRVEIPLKPSEFLEGLLLDPRYADWQVESLQAYCRRSLPGLVPLRSRLYTFDLTHSPSRSMRR